MSKWLFLGSLAVLLIALVFAVVFASMQDRLEWVVVGKVNEPAKSWTYEEGPMFFPLPPIWIGPPPQTILVEMGEGFILLLRSSFGGERGVFVTKEAFDVIVIGSRFDFENQEFWEENPTLKISVLR